MKRVAMSALVLRKSALSLVLATLPFIFLLTLSGQPADCSSEPPRKSWRLNSLRKR